MNRGLTPARVFLGILTLALVAGCAPALPQSTPGSQAGSSDAPGAATRKMLTVGVLREPTDLGVLFGQGSTVVSG